MIRTRTPDENAWGRDLQSNSLSIRAVGRHARPPLGCQIKPSKSKQKGLDFFLGLFVRIGIFQWITANLNKKI
jgi:hypothetical protein